MQTDERGNLNHVSKKEDERTKKRAVRPFRLPSVLERPSPLEDEIVSVRSAESIRSVKLPDVREKRVTGEVAPVKPQEVVEKESETEATISAEPTETREEPVIRATRIVKSRESRDRSKAEPITSFEPKTIDDEPASTQFVRKPRKFRINKRISSEKGSGRVERSAKKSVIPLRYKSLEEAMGGLRDFHPLPYELILTQTPHHATWLMKQLKSVNTTKELEELAYSLSHKDLSLLFTTLSTKKKRDEVDQIMNLIRLRASHYLYLCGWLTFQYCYPRSSVSRALSDLCTILEDLIYVRENRRQRKRFRREPLALPVVSVGEGRIIWSRVPLISQISLPNSRHFIADIATEMIESKVDPEAFFREYAIIPGQPLANAIEVRYNEMVTGVAANPLLSSNFFDRFRR